MLVRINYSDGVYSMERYVEGHRKAGLVSVEITEEDWRNREKWDAYQLAICDMVERTSTGEVPWTLVESNDKNFARVKILRTLCERLEEALKEPDPAPARKGKQSKLRDASKKKIKRKK